MRDGQGCGMPECPITFCTDYVHYDTAEGIATGEKMALVIKIASRIISLTSGWIIAKALMGLILVKMDFMANETPSQFATECKWQEGGAISLEPATPENPKPK